LSLAAALLVAGVIGIVVSSRSTAGGGAEAQVPFTGVHLQRVTDDGNVWSAALSSDGEFVAYVTDRDGARTLRLRHLASNSELELLPPAKGRVLDDVRFAADGRSVLCEAFSEEPESFDELWRVPLLGGPVQRLPRSRIPLELRSMPSPKGGLVAYTRQVGGNWQTGHGGVFLSAPDGSGERLLAQLPQHDFFLSVAWFPDGRRLLATHARRVMRPPTLPPVTIDVTSGRMERFPLCTTLPRRLGGFVALPGGEGFLAATDPRVDGQIWYVSTSGSTCRQLTHDPFAYLYIGCGRSRTDRLGVVEMQKIYNLWRVPLEGSGMPIRVTNGVNAGYGENGVAALPDGSIVFTARTSGSADLWVHLPSGERRRLTDDPGDETDPVATADGRTIVYVQSGWRNDAETRNVWRLDIAGGAPRALTDEGWAINPRISDGGKTVRYNREPDPEVGGPTQPMVVPIEGGTPVAATLPGPCEFPLPSHDGRWYRCYERKSDTTVVYATATGRIAARYPGALGGSWAPDDTGFAYVGGSEITNNLWFQPVTGPARQLTHFDSDMIMAFDWNRGGKSLVLSRGAVVTDVYLADFVRSGETATEPP